MLTFKQFLLEDDKMVEYKTLTQDQQNFQNAAMNPSGAKNQKEKRKDFEDEVTGKKPIFNVPIDKDVPAPVIDSKTGNEYSPKPVWAMKDAKYATSKNDNTSVS